MSKVPFYQVNSFTSEPFKGNPAGVVPLEAWLSDDVMQQIAAEANLSETAFVVPRGEGFAIRWFTPRVEVDLCGHATLAAGYVLFVHRAYDRDEIVFDSNSGTLRVRKGERLPWQLDFPVWKPVQVDVPDGAAAVIGFRPAEAFQGDTDLFLVLESEEQVRSVRPDLELVSGLRTRGVIVTAPGSGCDFVSRAFFPNVGVSEDPVTGSIHCALTPYWAGKLGRSALEARQLSQRGGELVCTLRGERVLIEGNAVDYLKGEIRITKE